jgi:hypothetical protein
MEKQKSLILAELSSPVCLDDPGMAWCADKGDTGLFAAALNELTRSDWGDRLADALRTPGATRARLVADIGSYRLSATVNPDGRWTCTPVGAGRAVNGHLRLWGRSAGDCGGVLRMIECGRMAAGLRPLGPAWGMTAAGWDEAEGLDTPLALWWVLDTDI